MRTIVLLCIGVLLVGPALGEGHDTHGGVVETEHFEIRYRPGSRAAASVERTAVMAERDLARICEALQIEAEGGLVLVLYDDVAELAAHTGTAGTGGFSFGNTSYLPYDNDQTRFHEMVHIVAYRLPSTGEEPRNLFHAEGLANALLAFVHGVPVHAVAAFYRMEGVLPSLDELTGDDFYAWQREHPQFNAYDVAGSYYRFLLDRYGAEKVKRYYTGTPARSALGSGADAVEKAWCEALEAYDLRPEVEILLRQRQGEPAAFEGYGEALWRVLVAEAEAEDWTPLSDEALRSDGTATWSKEDGVIHAVNEQGAWAACELGTETYEDCVVRVTIHTPAPLPVQVRLGADNQAMLVNGTFLYRGDQPVVSSDVASMTSDRKTTDFVLARRRLTIYVWIDGRLVLTAPAAAGRNAVGIGIHRGRASFEDARVRRLD
ncbi:MAG: hypothetical protein ACYTG6_06370 [Planctomycetota bacterium]|jgi:hypothetical protein